MPNVTAITEVVLATPQFNPFPPELGEMRSAAREIFGAGKVSGGDITAAAGNLTIPAGYLIAIPAREPNRTNLLKTISPVVLAADENDELFATVVQTATGLVVVLDTAATTPAGSLKLGDATGSPVDTFTQDDRVGGIQLTPPFFTQTESMNWPTVGTADRLANTSLNTLGIADVWSIGVWWKPVVPISGSPFLVSIKEASGNGNQIALYHDSSTNRLRLDWGDSSGTPFEITAWNGFYTGRNGLWTHVLLHWSGTTMFVLLNGVDQGAPDVGVNNPAITMTDTARQVAFGNNPTGNSSIVGNGAQFQMWNVDVRAAAAALQVSPSALDLNVDSGSYTFSGDLAHWWAPGKEVSPDLGKDYAQAGITPTIDIEANIEGLTDADRQADVP